MDFQLAKEQQLIALGIVASIVIGLAVMAFRPFFVNPSQQQLIVQPKNDQVTHNSVMVHVCGSVKREGVYKLNSGDRIMDAIALAGGARPLADLSAVNLAETVKDGEKILIPVKQIVTPEQLDSPGGNQTGQKSASPSAPININTADEKTLDSLPGVGPSTAKAIVEYRRTKGAFAKPEQLMEIPRFGKSRFERIKGMIII